MKLFKLIPIEVEHPSWQNSVKNKIILTIRAASEMDARKIATRKYYVIGKSCSLSQYATLSPWVLPTVVECIEIKADNGVNECIVNIENMIQT